MNLLTTSLLLSFASSAFGELNAFEDPDTLFLLTFQTPVGTFNNGDNVVSWGINGVIGTYSHPSAASATIMHNDHSTNPFCFTGLPLVSGGQISFKPVQSEWGQTGNFTIEIWAGAQPNTGYTYYESLVFGFPKHSTSTTTISAYSKMANVAVVTANFTTSATQTLEYAAATYNGTHFSIYQNGNLKLAQLLQRSVTTGITSPLVTIGGKTMSGLSSLYYTGTIYMVRYSGTAKPPTYFSDNYQTYVNENGQTMQFTGKTHEECVQLCLNGSYGFGGRKKCQRSYYTSDGTCTLQSFLCDWSGVVSSPV